jgi:5-methylcytosine-specific restriction endonuclease McrA
MKMCIECGRLIPSGSGSRCPLHPYRWRGGSTRQWRRTRERILERDGRQCTYLLNDGTRCPETTLLEVHHLYPGFTIDVPDDQLVTVCRRHNPRGG